MPAVNAEPYEFDFDPKTTALVMIDFQRDFVDPGGFGEALGNDVKLLQATGNVVSKSSVVTLNRGK